MKGLASFGVLASTLVAARLLLTEDIAVAAWSCAVGVLAAAGVVAGARVHRLPEAVVWRLLATGALLLPLAEVPHLVAGAGWTEPASSALSAAGVTAIGLALVLIVRRRSRGRDLPTLLDASVVVWGIAACTWLLLGPAFLAASPADRAQAGAEAVVALALLGLATYLLLDAGLRSVSNIAVGVAAAALVAGALAETSLALGSATPAWLVPVLAAVGALALGLAVVHPSIERFPAPPVAVDSDLRGWRIAVVGVGGLVAATSLLAYLVVPRDGAVVTTVLTGLLLLALLAGRTALIVVGYERFVDREHVLRECSAALVAADSREGVAKAVKDAAMTLAGGPRQALVEVTLAPRPDVTTIVNAVVAGNGAAADSLRGEIRLRGGLGRLGSARTIVAPVVVSDRLAGMVRVTGRRALPFHLAKSVETLAAQSVLALESVDHAEVRVAKETEARFRSLIQNSNDVIAIVDTGLAIRYVTPSVRAMLGYDVNDVVGSEIASLLHPSEVEDVTAVLAAVAQSDEPAVHEFRLRHRDGHWRVVESVVGNMLDDLSVRGLVLTAHDVTERRALEDQLAHQAFHDALSGLPNRALFGNRVDHAIERAARSGTDIAVLFVDLDDFKTVNDSLGHGIGDELLVAVGRRLAGCLRAADTAARLGGDEFAMLLEDVNGVDGAVGVAGRLLESLAQPVVVGHTEVYVRASIGIVIGQTGQSTEEMLRNADVAMYRAKGRGGNCFDVFEPAMHQAALTRLQLKADLERAFKTDGLHVEYQPIVSLATGEVVSVEALLRWRHPERGPISPLEFVPLAEETGLIVELGDWVLRQATSDALAWQRQLPPDLRLGISVNISGRQLQSPGFVERVSRSLAEIGIPPGDVILEITESTLMDEIELVIARLAEVRNLGVRVAVDDFGTGFSSLGYLQRFPVDILKIAKPFVDELGGEGRPARLVQAVIALARSLELDTIAEGIETQEQRRQLLELGCSLGQGYLFARPQRADDIRPLLRSRLAA